MYNGLYGITIIMLILFIVCVKAQEAAPRCICFYVNILCNYYIEINYDEVIDEICKTS
jgi:hypothetical protein